jgi:hypothetical protein
MQDLRIIQKLNAQAAADAEKAERLAKADETTERVRAERVELDSIRDDVLEDL